MTRTNLIASIAAAVGSTMLFASAAQACISCEYVPEVVDTPRDSDRHTNRPEGSHAATIEMRQRVARAQAARAQAAQAQMLKAQAFKAQAAKAQMAKAMAAKARAAAAKKVEIASLTQKEEDTAAKSRAVKAASGNTVESPSSGTVSNREKLVSTATLLVNESVPAETSPSEPVACKKFIAAIGTTITVPCK